MRIYKIAQNNLKRIYKIIVKNRDGKDVTPKSIVDKRVKAINGKQAFVLFCKKYSVLNDYRSDAFEIITEIDIEKEQEIARRNAVEEEAKKRTIEEAWWNN